ncbi:MAG TPA: FtsX-like permease family protein [Azospirillum sp.]|nr:FtsX-like permease family protein [Azospirillum sp.]
MRRWIERQRCLVDFTVSSLLRRRGKNLGLIVVYTIIIFVLASVMLFSQALRREAAAVLSNAPEIVVQRMVAGRHDTVPAAYVETIRAIRGVAQAEGRLWGYYFDPGLSANYTLMVPADRTVEPGSAVIGHAIARERNGLPGTPLFLLSERGKMHKFTVAGILDRVSDLIAADLMLVAERDFRSMFAIPADALTDIAVSVRNPREVATIAAKISRILPDVRAITRGDILRTYEAAFNWREGMVLVLMTGAVLAFLILAWDKASGLSAEERREIGILKAVGWETSDVIRQKLWEGALISLTAFLFGYALAYLHVFRFDALLFEPALKGWAVLYPRFELRPSVDAFQVGTLLVLTMLPYILATVVPVWRAATIDPDVAMR